jgi:hypothetical protein
VVTELAVKELFCFLEFRVHPDIWLSNGLLPHHNLACSNAWAVPVPKVTVAE